MIKRLLVSIALVAPFPAAAATAYISDDLRVPMRSSPCPTCAIVHRGLPAGTALTVVGSDGDWTQVSTSSGLNGWVPSQYLVRQPIARDRLAAVEQSYDQLKTENDALKTQLATLQENQTTLESSSVEARESKEALEMELATIKKISGNALALQEQNDELVKRNRILQSEIDVLTANRDRLASNATQRWFIYGALAVFLGAILTVLIPRLKPRRKFSEWA